MLFYALEQISIVCFGRAKSIRVVRVCEITGGSNELMEEYTEKEKSE